MFSQVVGVTSSLPEQVPSYLDSASDNEWLYKDRVLIHSAEETDFPHLESLDIISPGESVGLLLTATGSLHIYFNGKLVERIATGLPVNQPLWGVVDVYGTCIKVKSEVLGGKLDDMRAFDLCSRSLVHCLVKCIIICARTCT